MAFVGERCFKLHRIMLMAMGLWPYQKPFIWRIQTVFFFTIYFCFLSSQLLTFVTMACNMDCTMKRFSYVCICFVYILNYYCFYFNPEIIKKALRHMQFEWQMFANSDAIKIFENYLFDAYIFVLGAFIFIILATIIFVTFECRPIILDVFIPMNESRPRRVEMDFQLFVNQEQYFFLYLTHEVLGVLVGIWSIVTTAAFLNTIGKHFCATYKIASSLIENMVTVQTLQIPVAERIQFMYRNICLSVHMHRKTLELCTGLVISCNIWYFPLLILSVTSLSCILFRLYNAVMQLNDIYDIVTCLILLYCYLIYMFLANFYVQSYTDHSGKILEAIYDTLWYIAPLPIQKLFLIMQKTIKSHKIVVAGLFVPSIEGFSTLMTSAVSYFTVMHAMR
ncbi:hypothetical protein HN011_004101 [Eciton burchellii]|nr:hypothetical protein HN011_004101 [Eciton burchellii]